MHGCSCFVFLSNYQSPSAAQVGINWLIYYILITAHTIKMDKPQTGCNSAAYCLEKGGFSSPELQWILLALKDAKAKGSVFQFQNPSQPGCLVWSPPSQLVLCIDDTSAFYDPVFHLLYFVSLARSSAHASSTTSTALLCTLHSLG